MASSSFSALMHPLSTTSVESLPKMMSQNVKRTFIVVDDPGTIDEVDAFGECHILPDSGFAGYRCCLAHLPLLEGVDDGTLADIGVADKADRHSLLVLMELIELSNEVDEGALTEGVVEVRSEGQRGKLFGEVGDPPARQPCGNEIALVEHEHEMLVGTILFDVLLDVVIAGAQRITSINHDAYDVGSIQHFVEFLPDTFALSCQQSTIDGLIELHESLHAMECLNTLCSSSLPSFLTS